MDPLLGPARPESEPTPGGDSAYCSPSAAATEPTDGSAQTILDAWLQQLQAEQTEEPVVESRLDIDSLFGSELEFDLDFLTELSNLKGAGSGDGGVSLHELSQDLELSLLCPPEAPPEPESASLGVLSEQELFADEPPPLATPTSAPTSAPATTPACTLPSEPEPTSTPAPVSTPATTAAPATAGAGTGAGVVATHEPPSSVPARPPPVASISVVTNKQRGKTVITISTPRGRQSFVLPTADLTQASRVLRALQQKRRRSRARAAATAAAAGAETTAAGPAQITDAAVAPLSAAVAVQPKTPSVGRTGPAHAPAKEDDDPVMSEALKHLGVDMSLLSVRKNGQAVELACPEPGCDVTLQHVFKLKVHILKHRNYKPYKCSAEGCKWAFFERGKLNRHEATHAKASLKCGEPGCPAAFRTRTNLQRHRLRVHGLSTAQAARTPVRTPDRIPDRTSDRISDRIPDRIPDRISDRIPDRIPDRTSDRTSDRISDRIADQIPDQAPERTPALANSDPESGEDAADRDPLTTEQFLCNICERTFKRATGLKRHLNWHETQATSACPFPGCQFTAPSLQQLRLHEKRHGEKQYKCTFPECSWAFHSHAKLKRHLSQHTGRRNYRCPYAGCEKAYRRMEYLSGHIRLHLGRYYQCPQKGCRLRFTHQFSLATHLRSVHGTPSAADVASPVTTASVSCPLCEARFKSDTYRQIHLQDVHGTSSSKLLQPDPSARPGEETSARKKKSKFNPESLNWVEDADSAMVDNGETYAVYLPFEVETDSGPSEVLVKCDVTEEECHRLGIELGPEVCDGDTVQPPASYDRVLSESNTSKDTARQLRRMGVGVLSPGLRRAGHSGCARTDITSCHLAVRRSRPRPRRPPTGRQRRPAASPRKHTERADGASAALYERLPFVPESACRTVLEPPSLLCDSDLLGSVHEQLQHSTINLNDLT